VEELAPAIWCLDACHAVVAMGTSRLGTQVSQGGMTFWPLFPHPRLFTRLLRTFAGPRFGVRHLQCILVFFGLAVAYSLRVNLSVAIVAMTDRNASNPDFPVCMPIRALGESTICALFNADNSF